MDLMCIRGGVIAQGWRTPKEEGNKKDAAADKFRTRYGQQNVVQEKCCIIDCAGKNCGMTVEIIQRTPQNCWNHLEKHHKTEFKS
jgi:hypothetical protein